MVPIGVRTRGKVLWQDESGFSGVCGRAVCVWRVCGGGSGDERVHDAS